MYTKLKHVVLLYAATAFALVRVLYNVSSAPLYCALVESASAKAPERATPALSHVTTLTAHM